MYEELPQSSREKVVTLWVCDEDSEHNNEGHLDGLRVQEREPSCVLLLEPNPGLTVVIRNANM